MPLILTSLSDEYEEISSLAASYWAKIGIQYESENEERLKSQLDYPKPRKYIPALENIQRFPLGCRDLVQSALIRLLPGIKNDIADWQDETKLAAARLLRQLLIQG